MEFDLSYYYYYYLCLDRLTYSDCMLTCQDSDKYILVLCKMSAIG